jgi:DNA-binding transcriptional ArsR family regulator
MLDETPTPDLNLTALASASMAKLLGLLTRSLRSGGTMEPRPDQLAGYVLAETVHLIRLGTRPELADASAVLSRLLTTQVAGEIAEHYPAAHTALNSAADVLVVAASPSSRGGEFTVLRSYSGRALAAVWHVDRAECRALPRAELLGRLGIEESYMSHILADLETAGLIERIREGRNVTVHLGPRGYTAEVQRQLKVTPREEIVGTVSLAATHEHGTVEDADVSRMPVHADEKLTQASLRWSYAQLEGIENGLMPVGRYREALEQLFKLQEINAIPVPHARISELTIECFRHVSRHQVADGDVTSPHDPQAGDRRLARARSMMVREA